MQIEKEGLLGWALITISACQARSQDSNQFQGRCIMTCARIASLRPLTRHSQTKVREAIYADCQLLKRCNIPQNCASSVIWSTSLGSECHIQSNHGGSSQIGSKRHNDNKIPGTIANIVNIESKYKTPIFNIWRSSLMPWRAKLSSIWVTQLEGSKPSNLHMSTFKNRRNEFLSSNDRGWVFGKRVWEPCSSLTNVSLVGSQH